MTALTVYHQSTGSGCYFEERTVFLRSFGFLQCLFQELVWLPTQRLRNSYNAGKRNVVFGTFHSTDVRPVHVGTFGKRLLRKLQFFSKCPHIFGHPLAILVVHVDQFWKKMPSSDIEVKTMEYNTRRNVFRLDRKGVISQFWQKASDGAGIIGRLCWGRMSSTKSIGYKMGG
jgi:hypothetical protein